MNKKIELKKAKLIFNPHSGEKRNKNPLYTKVSLEEIKALLRQYQIPVDYFPTRYAKHATVLAQNSVKEGYDLVIAAGGDGTVGEVVNGLVGTDIPVAILPLGTVMNVARMLSIPLEMEKAVQLIKIRRIRKIDVGSVTKLGGETMEKPYYFLEQAGIGLDSIMHYYYSGLFDRREYLNIFRIIKKLIIYFGHRTKIYCDGKLIETRAPMVTISNGPLGALALALAPDAKLNDHKLTVTVFDMSKIGLTVHLIKLLFKKRGKIKNTKTYQGEKVKIVTDQAELVHADARLYGNTPVEIKIIPNALNVITGFPKPENSSLLKRTYLDP